MRVMIHACPKRMWYVEGYLVPKLVEQGIPKKSIVVWNDEAGKGNLVSCMEAFRWCGEHPVKDGTWHLQDDVIPAVDFAKKAESIADDVACGFRPGHRGRLERRCMRERNENGGYVSVRTQGWTFQCFRISDRIAGECAKWFFEEAPKDERFRAVAETGQSDDWFFIQFLRLHYPDMSIMYAVPNIVEHIAELIGGSTLTPGQGFTSSAFPDRGEWREAEDWIRSHGI